MPKSVCDCMICGERFEDYNALAVRCSNCLDKELPNHRKVSD